MLLLGIDEYPGNRIRTWAGYLFIRSSVLNFLCIQGICGSFILPNPITKQAYHILYISCLQSNVNVVCYGLTISTLQDSSKICQEDSVSKLEGDCYDIPVPDMLVHPVIMNTVNKIV